MSAYSKRSVAENIVSDLVEYMKIDPTEDYKDELATIVEQHLEPALAARRQAKGIPK